MSQKGNEDGQQQQDTAEAPLKPRRLELSLSPEDGSLLTAPLSTVLLSATDGLYSDLYNMAHGEMEVAQQLQKQTPSSYTAAAAAEESEAAAATTATEEDTTAITLQPLLPTLMLKKKEQLSNLSFAQRRHELAWRIAQHGKSLTQVAALTAAAASGDFGHNTRVATKALQHARTAWVQADEAQDALYFFHARLFPARQAPHDVLGALNVCLRGEWTDLPTDLQLKMDRYDYSTEQTWTASQVADRWHMAVRDKLLNGEVGWMQRQKLSDNFDSLTSPSPLWKASLRGGVLRITHGIPRRIGSNNGAALKLLYPLEAHVAVLSTAPKAEWTLLSIKVRAQAKTGESNHQLEPTSRQQYNLHRLCAQAMTKEEKRRVAAEAAADDKKMDCEQQQQPPPPRPLDCMFRVAHAFGLSWQLEILSAQAQGLKRGAWAAATALASGLVVTPVQFTDDNHLVLGQMSISFWSVDDRYGPPCMGDLTLEPLNQNSKEEEQDEVASKVSSTTSRTTKASRTKNGVVSNQLTLTIRAESQVGIQVSLSGGDAIMGSMNKSHPEVQNTVEQLLEATSNPFALSASDALLAATRLCAARKCHAIVESLQPEGAPSSVLPSWMHLTVELGSIAVAARVDYHKKDAAQERNSRSSQQQRPFVVLFRLACDARTGTFVSTFPRSASLLRLLACNDLTASENMAIRTARLAQNQRKATVHGTGRFVREAFDGLTRSMNVLGKKTGVGGSWEDLDDKSASLRQRAIQLACADVRTSLITCCGMAAMYGLSALALGVGTGLTAEVDMAGGPLEAIDGLSLLPSPPVSIVLDQQMIQKTSVASDGETKKQSLLEREVFAVSCTVTDEAIALYGFDITVQTDSPSSPEDRVKYSLIELSPSKVDDVTVNGDDGDGRPLKRPRIESNGTNGGKKSPSHRTLMDEVEYLASVFSNTLDDSK